MERTSSQALYFHRAAISGQKVNVRSVALTDGLRRPCEDRISSNDISSDGERERLIQIIDIVYIYCGLAFHPQFNASILFSRTYFADKIRSLLNASEKAGALSNLAPHKFGQNRDDLSFADRFALFSFTAICCFMRRPICNDKNHQPLLSEQTTIGHNNYCPSPFLN